MMNRAQKIAWYNLTVIIASLTISGTAIGILTILYGMPTALGGLGFLGIAALVGLSPILFRKRRGQISFDERDQLIHKRATLAAYSIFWFFFTAACMIPWWILETGARIRVTLLPCMLAGGFIIVQLVQSVAILVQYGWRNKGEKS
ncbi:MAG: hypothetical protein ACYS0I_01775 [Planctomycetota bacterium]|jgi:hypothetical protein